MIYFIALFTFLNSFSHSDLSHLYPLSANLICHSHFCFSYSPQHKQAEWVMYELTATEAVGNFNRTDNFRIDDALRTSKATLSDYRHSGYDRGHLAPAADMAFSSLALSESFFLSNISPQDPSFNRGIWQQLEELFRAWAVEDGDIFIVTGPVLKNVTSTIGTGKVSVPGWFYKIAIDIDGNDIRSIAFILPNTKCTAPLSDYVVSIDSVEILCSIDFIPGLEDSVENLLEAGTYGYWNYKPAQVRKDPESAIKSKRCSGITLKGIQCKRSTKDPGGRCWQHQGSYENSTLTPQCQGTTQSGKRCQRRVKIGDYCWQHE